MQRRSPGRPCSEAARQSGGDQSELADCNLRLDIASRPPPTGDKGRRRRRAVPRAPIASATRPRGPNRARKRPRRDVLPRIGCEVPLAPFGDGRLERLRAPAIAGGRSSATGRSCDIGEIPEAAGNRRALPGRAGPCLGRGPLRHEPRPSGRNVRSSTRSPRPPTPAPARSRRQTPGRRDRCRSHQTVWPSAFERGGERPYPARVLARVAQEQRCHPTPPLEASLLRRTARPFNFLLLSLLDSDTVPTLRVALGSVACGICTLPPG